MDYSIINNFIFIKIKSKNYIYSKCNITEILIVFGLLGIFLYLGSNYGSSLNPVWLDEVAYVEPGANIFFGNGYTSLVWFHQNKNDFHVSPSFLYNLSIYTWSKLFSFSITSIRLMNFCLLSLGVFILWITLLRYKIIKSAGIRILLLIMILTINAIVFSYTSGRYDTLCMTIAILTFCGFKLKNKLIRGLIIVFLGFLSPFAGLALVTYFIIMMCLILTLIQDKLQTLKSFCLLIIGFLLGFFALYLIYSYNKVLDIFTGMALGFSVLRGSGQASGNFLMDTVVKFLGRLESILSPRGLYFDLFTNDVSWQLLTISILILIFYSLSTKTFKFQSYNSLGLASAFIIPGSIYFVSDYFPLYFYWMSLIPLSFAVCASIDNIYYHKKSFFSWMVIALISVLCLRTIYLGLPTSIINLEKQNLANSYVPMTNYIRKYINKDDVVYSDFSAFYAVKPLSKEVFFPLHYSQMSEEDKSRVNLIIYDPRATSRADWNRDVKEIFPDFPAQWHKNHDVLNTYKYVLEVYHRKSETKE